MTAGDSSEAVEARGSNVDVHYADRTPNPELAGASFRSEGKMGSTHGRKQGPGASTRPLKETPGEPTAGETWNVGNEDRATGILNV